jgi:RimJ/RimL family protein N-acetyltransferase
VSGIADTVAPVLTTPRLVMRGHRAADFEASFALWGDPDVVRLISGKPSSREECWARLLRYAGLWPVLGFGYWLLEARGDGRFVGEAGFADFRRDLEPAFGDALEAGWLIAPCAQGKGYATEAMQAALAWAGATLGPRRSVCMVAPDNTASLRVAAKCGYREYARGTYQDSPTILLERAVRLPSAEGR